jgi:2'-5' RNA ligase
MALAVCLLFDEVGDRALRGLWDRLEAVDVRTLRSHTHGEHHPHLSYAVLDDWDLEPVRTAVESLPDHGSFELTFHAVATFRRGRAWLVPGVDAGLVSRQAAVVEACDAASAAVHPLYRPGAWVPHCTLAPRVRLEQLPDLAAATYDVLPLTVHVGAAALIDSSTGRLWPLINLP